MTLPLRLDESNAIQVNRMMINLLDLRKVNEFEKRLLNLASCIEWEMLCVLRFEVLGM